MYPGAVLAGVVWGLGLEMTNKKPRSVHDVLPDLENIDWLISRIESHWGMLLESQAGSEFMDRIRGQYRREWLDNPLFVAPSRPIADALVQLIGSDLVQDDRLQAVIENALWFALQADQRPLTDVELARFGWELTRLVALDMEPVKEALAQYRKAGGTASGESRREANVDRDASICAAGRRLMAAGISERDLAGAIERTAKGCGLSTKTIRTILRAGQVKGK